MVLGKGAREVALNYRRCGVFIVSEGVLIGYEGTGRGWGELPLVGRWDFR